MGVIEKILYELSIDVKLLASEAYSFDKLLSFNDIENIKKWAEESIESVMVEIKPYYDISSKTIIQKAKKYIKENYSKDLQLSEVAEHIFISRIYFSKLFKKQTGENFSDYLMIVRMEEALRLLANHELKIYEVSDKVGYKNVKYFVKLFKTYTGVTPSEYRNRLFQKN